MSAKDHPNNVLAAGEADVHLPAGTDDPTLHWNARRGARQVGVFVADIA